MSISKYNQFNTPINTGIDNTARQQAKLPTLEHLLVTGKTPTLVITKEFQAIFEFFCAKNKAVEWSGIMFYRMEGSFSDINSIIVTPIDIYLMDIGTSGHTEFTTDASIIGYQMREGLLDCFTGLCHSHNNMNVFFSNEDISELNDVAPLSLFYVSLIVNNKSEMTCKLAFVGDVESNITYSTSLNQNDLKPVAINLVKKKKLITVDFDIVSDIVMNIPKKYEERLATVLSNKVPIHKPALIPTITNRGGSFSTPSNPTLFQQSTSTFPPISQDVFSPFDTLTSEPVEIDDDNIVEFLAALLQEDDTLTLEQMLGNLINDKSIKAGEIVISVEDEFLEAANLIFGDLDLNAQNQLVAKTIELLTPNVKKPKIKAIVTGLQNYIFNADKDPIQKW